METSLPPEPPQVIRVDPLALEPRVTAPGAINLACISQGRPAPAIIWLRDGVPLVEEERGKVEVTVRTVAETTESRLRVDPTGYEDRGNYSCIATNVAGEDSYVFQLILQSECVATSCFKFAFVKTYDYLHTSCTHLNTQTYPHSSPRCHRVAREGRGQHP